MTRFDDGESRKFPTGRVLLALAAGAGIGALGWWSHQAARRAPGVPDSAPERTSRRVYYGDYAVVGRTVTISRPRAELFAFWREFRNLPRFMENIESVDVDGEISTWTIKAPAGGRIHVRTRVVAETENEEIAWRSVEGSDLDTEGKVTFREAPGGRGTEVEAIVAYVPPAGQIGMMIAKLFQREPRMQGRRELKRFKMLMETGEVATSRNRKAA